MDRQRIINLLAAISAITVFGFTLGLMFPLLSLIMEREGIPSQVIGYSAALLFQRQLPAGVAKADRRHARHTIAWLLDLLHTQVDPGHFICTN